jgi:uncharacterized membrane protein
MTGEHDAPPAGGGFGKNRIEALADGIFAVAMTLLVLDVKIPQGEFFRSDGELWLRLLSLEHTFIIYFISFIVLGMFWVGHHAQFHYIRYVDHTILWLNLIFLFGITSIPFATDVLGDFYHLRLPYALYGAKLIGLAGLLLLQILYLRRYPELAQPALTAEVARRIALRTAVFAVVPVVSMAFAFYNSHWAVYSYFLLLVVHFLPGRVDTFARTATPGDRQPPSP